MFKRKKKSAEIRPHHTKHIENYGPKMNCHACGKNFVPIITHNQYYDLARLIQGWHDYVNCNLRIANAKCQKFQELFFISLCMVHESRNPAGTRRNNNVIITSGRRRFDVIMMLLSLHVPPVDDPLCPTSLILLSKIFLP